MVVEVEQGAITLGAKMESAQVDIRGVWLLGHGVQAFDDRRQVSQGLVVVDHPVEMGLGQSSWRDVGQGRDHRCEAQRWHKAEASYAQDSAQAEHSSHHSFSLLTVVSTIHKIR